MFGFTIPELKTYTIVALVVMLAYFGFRALRSVGRKLPTSTSTWKSYLKGQGDTFIRIPVDRRRPGIANFLFWATTRPDLEGRPNR